MLYGPTASMMVPLKSSVWATVDSMGRKRRTRVLHKVTNVGVRPLQNFELKTFIVKNREFVE